MSVLKTKYEFGRHETFTLREGWLDKGLDHIIGNKGFKADLGTADELGLGKNMVKSLQYWLEATGLAVRARDGTSKALPPLLVSGFGERLAGLDPHFEYSISTWYVHMMLARRRASVWNWFFNDFRNGVFDRETSIESFQRHVREHALNQTTLSVLQREVGCLLGTYAALPPSEPLDPEDFTISPLRSLSLLVKHPDTGRYEKAVPLDAVPVEAFLACVQWLTEDADSASLPLSDLISRRNSPARLFNMDGDTINELAHKAAELHGGRGVRLSLLGSTRTITMPSMNAADWYDMHFTRIGG